MAIEIVPREAKVLLHHHQQPSERRVESEGKLLPTAQMSDKTTVKIANLGMGRQQPEDPLHLNRQTSKDKKIYKLKQFDQIKWHFTHLSLLQKYVYVGSATIFTLTATCLLIYYLAFYRSSTQVPNGTVSARNVTLLAGSSTTAGFQDGRASVALFNQPSSCVVDSSNNVYIADTGNSAIRMISASGQVTTLFSSTSSSSITLSKRTSSISLVSPKGLSIDNQDRLYITDIGDNTIKILNLTSLTLSILAGSPGSGGFSNGLASSALFNQPFGIALDGTVYIADTNNEIIRSIAGGIVSTFSIFFTSPSGLAIDSNHFIFVCDSAANNIQKCSPTNGTCFVIAGDPGGVAGNLDGQGQSSRFNSPTSLVIDANDVIYVSDTGNRVIRRIDAEGLVSTIGGTSLSQPAGLAISATGALIVTSPAFNNIQEITLDQPAAFISQAPQVDMNITAAPTTLSDVITTTADSSSTSSTTTTIDMVASTRTVLSSTATAEIGTTLLFSSSSSSNLANPTSSYPSSGSTVQTTVLETTIVEGVRTTSSVSPALSSTSAYLTTYPASSTPESSPIQSIAAIAVEGIVSTSPSTTPTTISTSSNTVFSRATTEVGVTTRSSTTLLSSLISAIPTNPTSSLSYPSTVQTSVLATTIVEVITTSSVSPASSSTSSYLANPTASLSFPNSGTAGQPFQVLAKIQDFFGYSLGASQVQLGFFRDSNCSVNVFQALANYSTNTTGFVNFPSVFLNQSGVYYFALNFTYLANTFTTCFPSYTTVSSAPPTSISFVSFPSPTVANQLFSPQPLLFLSDQYGNAVSGQAISLTPYIDSSCSVKSYGTIENGNAMTNSSGYAIFTGTFYNYATTIYFLASTPGLSSCFGRNMTVSWSVGLNVTTIAGNGTLGELDGQGSLANLHDPWALFYDSYYDAIFFTEYSSNPIRMMNSSYYVSTISGSIASGYQDGSVKSARFNEPCQVSSKSDGDLYLVDSQNCVIRKITNATTAMANVSTIAGVGPNNCTSVSGQGKYASLNKPKGLYVKPNGDIIIAETSGARISILNSTFYVSSLCGSGVAESSNGPCSSTLTTLHNPISVTGDAAGNLYIADQYAYMIRKINSTLFLSTIAGTGSQGSANGPALLTTFNNPTSVTLDIFGNLYIADKDSHTIRILNSSGYITSYGDPTKPTVLDGSMTKATFNAPLGVTINKNGQLFTCDSTYIRMISGK